MMAGTLLRVMQAGQLCAVKCTFHHLPASAASGQGERDLTARAGVMVGYGQPAGAGLACQPDRLIKADYLIAGALLWRAQQCGVGGAAKEADVGIEPSLAKDVEDNLLDFMQ